MKRNAWLLGVFFLTLQLFNNCSQVEFSATPVPTSDRENRTPASISPSPTEQTAQSGEWYDGKPFFFGKDKCFNGAPAEAEIRFLRKKLFLVRENCELENARELSRSSVTILGDNITFDGRVFVGQETVPIGLLLFDDIWVLPDGQVLSTCEEIFTSPYYSNEGSAVYEAQTGSVFCVPSQADETVLLNPGAPLMIDIASSTQDFNLFNEASAQGWNVSRSVIVQVAEDAQISSTNPSTPAFQIGAFPSTASITILNRGLIAGAGGQGGQGIQKNNSNPGEDGGDAFRTSVPVTLFNSGTIASGGGGGGAGGGGDCAPNLANFWGGSGGGGAGATPGVGGLARPTFFGANSTNAGSNGTLEAGGPGSNGGSTSGGCGGQGGRGGNGGAPGQPGEAGRGCAGGCSNGAGQGSPGGAPGSSVVGADLIQWATNGTLIGPTQ